MVPRAVNRGAQDELRAMPALVDDSTFRQFRRQDLSAIRAQGGVVLVDHYARDTERTSVLHASGCKWLGAVGQYVSLRYASDERDAVRWLRRNRGDEGDFWKRCRACGGRAQGTDASAAMPRYDAKQDVVFHTPASHVGRIKETVGQSYDVEVFRGPGNDVEVVRIPSKTASSHALVRGDIVWWEDVGEGWSRGAVNSASDSHVTVGPGRAIRRVEKDAVRVRDFGPVRDPLALLSAGFAGDRDATEKRRAFLAGYYKLKAAQRGLSGVLSAPVSLFPHQLDVVRRVLDDPVQRYLLADEVGLGKTIEAGLLIRQRLIDAPRSTVVVLVPSQLVPQWQDELEDRLGLHWFRQGGIEVAAHEDDRSWKRLQVPDLVVIDEAHRIAAGWGSRVKEEAERYALAQKLTDEAARVLLLSATPVLNRERDLLAMLHLLDPDTFRLDDFEAFEAKVRRREEIGRLFLSIGPDTPPFLLDGALSDIRENFPEDRELGALISVIDVGAENGSRELGLAEVRGHLTDSYRIHARLIRNRRAGIAGKLYDVRGRSLAPAVFEADPRRPQVERWLENLRAALVSAANDRGEEWISIYAEAFWCFVQASTGDLQCLRHAALYKTTLRRQHLARSGIDLAARGALKAVETTPEIREALDEVIRLLEPERDFEGNPDEAAEIRVLARAVASACDGPTVVFTSAASTAQLLCDELMVLSPGGVEALTADLNRDERRGVLTAFRDGIIATLVCDASAEEGLNLQNATTVVHADLPRATSRVEQRIGRADRHGGVAGPVQCRVFMWSNEGFAEAWLALLSDVFGVFRASTSSTMFAIEAVEMEQRRAWFLDGLPNGGAEDAVGALRLKVEEEQRRIDRLDEFDLLAQTDLRSDDFIDRVIDAETSHATSLLDASCELSEVVGPALDLKLGLGDGITVGVTVGRTTSATADFRALCRPGGGTWTSSRVRAVDGQDAALMLPGDPIVELLREQADWDESCQLFVARMRGTTATAAVRADFVVAADPTDALDAWQHAERERPNRGEVRTDADAALAVAALQRRVDAFLPPQALTLWFDENAEVITDREWIEVLERQLADPEATSEWTSESTRDLGALLGATTANEYFATVRRRAPNVAVERSHASGDIESATAQARIAWGERVARLRLRHRRGEEAAGRAADVAARVDDALLAALRAPVARWSSVALLIVEDD